MATSQEVYSKVTVGGAGTACELDKIVKSPTDCFMVANQHAKATNPSVSIDEEHPFSPAQPDERDKFDYPAGCNIGGDRHRIPAPGPQP